MWRGLGEILREPAVWLLGGLALWASALRLLAPDWRDGVNDSPWLVLSLVVLMTLLARTEDWRGVPLWPVSWEVIS